MQIFVKLSGKTITLYVSASDLVDQVKPGDRVANRNPCRVGVGRARATRTSDITFSLIYKFLVLRLPSSTYCHNPPVSTLSV